MSDAIRRAIRTFFQGFVGILVIVAIPALNNLIGDIVNGDGQHIDIDLEVWRSIVIAAVAGGVISLISFLQNFLEDNTNMPSVLKSTPSAGQNPVTEDAAK